MAQLQTSEKRVSIRLPSKLAHVLEELTKRYGCKTESETIRYLIREKGKELGLIEG